MDDLATLRAENSRLRAALEAICDPVFAKDWRMMLPTLPEKGLAVTKMQEIARAALDDAPYRALSEPGFSTKDHQYLGKLPFDKDFSHLGGVVMVGAAFSRHHPPRWMTDDDYLHFIKSKA